MGAALLQKLSSSSFELIVTFFHYFHYALFMAIPLGLFQKKVSPGGRMPMKFRGTTNTFKLNPPPQLFHILGKPPHQQI